MFYKGTYHSIDENTRNFDMKVVRLNVNVNVSSL